jgi:hypothetical protein
MVPTVELPNVACSHRQLHGPHLARCAVAGRAVGYQLYNEFRAGKLDDLNLQGVPRRTPPTGCGGWMRLAPRRNRYRLADNRPTPRRKTARWISGSCRRLMWVPTLVRPGSRIDLEMQGFPEQEIRWLCIDFQVNHRFWARAQRA